MAILEPDWAVRFPLVTVIKASAGSGKTYTLTERYVQFILSGEIPRNDLRNILAITFSNNASREMKKEVLGWLKRLHFADPERTSDMAAIVAGGERRVGERAGRLIEEILLRYTDFQVRTIDSFMSMVFRAAALDLGFGPDFEILLDPDPLIDYAFNLFLREAREGSAEAAFLDETIGTVLGYQAEDDAFSWDPSAPLLAEIRKVERKLAMLDQDPRRADLSSAMKKVGKKIEDTLEMTQRLIDASGLEPNGKSTFPDALAAARSGRFSELFSKGMKCCPVKKPAKGKSLETFTGIQGAWERTNALVSEYAGLWARSFYLPYLRLHGSLAAAMDRVKKSQGRIFLGDVDRRLGEYLAAEIVPDVYFRIGEKVFHFLIDEFQDTSPVQWRNLFPLIENSLAEGGSLFVVGDTKQAIYGFRQADYRIMKALEKGSPFPSAGHAVKELPDNFRSRPRILRFTEEVFQTAASLDRYREAAEASGLDRWTQEARPGEDPGYVEMEILARDDEDPPERLKIQSLMKELHDRGYRWGDIAILAPRNSDVVRATSWLNETGIPFISFSSLDVRQRKVAAEIISLLRFLDSPPDDLSFSSFVLGEIFARSLNRRHGWASNAPLHRFLFDARESRPRYKAFQNAFPELWGRYFSDLFRSTGYLPLYDLVSEIFAVFGMFDLAMEEEATLAKLLEAVKDFEGSGANSLRDFLTSASDSTGEESRWTIEVPRGVDSVRAMTVHKAKGLGFPVVAVILYGMRNKGLEYTVERDDAGLSLVKLNKSVADRNVDLDALYRNERTRELIDRLNGLYVSLTRAKKEMYVIGVKGERDTSPFDLLPSSGFAPLEDKGPARSEAGESGPISPLLHITRPVAPASGRRRLAVEERKRGEIIHRMLSLIPYAEDDLEGQLSRAAERARREAREASAEPGLADGLSRMIRGVLEEHFRPRPGRTVLTEQEFCDEEGRLFRMDRVIIDPGRVTVLDFKTGGEEADREVDEIQMRVYARILSQAYPGRHVEALLVSIDRGTIRRVM
jgi:ATP-dependent exoDNAse (exonuclease V) beta subunit